MAGPEIPSIQVFVNWSLTLEMIDTGGLGTCPSSVIDTRYPIPFIESLSAVKEFLSFYNQANFGIDDSDSGTPWQCKNMKETLIVQMTSEIK